MHSTARRSTIATAVLALALTAAGCTGGQPKPAQPTVDHWPPSPGGPGVTAPTTFGPDGPALPYQGEKAMLPEDSPGPVALIGTTAYLTETGDLAVVDTGSGRVLARVAAPWPTAALGVDDAPPNVVLLATPVVTTVGGRQVVVDAWLADPREPGASTPSPVLELAVVDTATDHIVRSWKSDLPPGVNLAGTTDALLTGVSGDTAVLGLNGSAERGGKAWPVEVTYGVDLSSGRLSWSRSGFEAGQLTADAVVGLQDSSADALTGGGAVTALDPATGRTLWTRPKSSSGTVEQGGPDYVVIDRGSSTKAGPLDLVSAADGRTVAQLPTVDGLSYIDCTYDDASITVCSSDAEVLAFDAHSGALLWSESEGSPTEPNVVSTAWHGHFYGRDNRGRAAVWDARTGRELDTLPTDDLLEPSLFDGQVAVVLSDEPDGRIHAHRILG